jgi:O-antigen/teichoic acid export membrane protein
MLVWASIRPDVWALLAGSLASSALRLLLSFVALPGRGNRFGWEPEARRELLRFGRWIFLSTLTTFVAMQADRLILGFMVPMGMLGVYAIAQTISRMPVEVLESVTQSVTFPAYSRVREKGGDLPRAFAVARLPLVWAGGLGLSLLALLGPALIGFLYDDRYREAGWIVQVLAAGALLQILHTTLADALLALGQPQWIAAGNGAKIASMAVFLPLGYSSFGFAGALGGLAAAELPKYLLQALRARRCGLRGWGVELSAAAAFAACVALPACARRWLDAGPSLRAAVAGAGFAVVWGLLSLWMGRTWLRQRRTPGLAGGML